MLSKADLIQLNNIILDYRAALNNNDESELFVLLRKSMNLYSDVIPQLLEIYNEIRDFGNTISPNSKAIVCLLERLYNNCVDSGYSSNDLILNKDRTKVFIVHGKDENMLASVKDAISKFGLTPIVLREQSNGGRSIIEKFEDNSETCDFAIILLSDKEDYGYQQGYEVNGKPRARQNVILELGYFVGKLGRKKHICILKKGDVEQPSDILGLVYTPFDGDNQWVAELKKELIYAGYMIE